LIVGVDAPLRLRLRRLSFGDKEVQMAKFKIISEQSASDATARVYKQILKVKHLRIVPNFFKTLANSPAVLQGTWTAYRNVSTRGSISEVLKEMIFVAISAAKHCTYCEAAHIAFCRILKVDTETCKNLVNNIDGIRPENTRDIVKFGLKAGMNPQGIDDADYKILKRHGIDDAGIIEIVAMSGFAMNAITIADALKLDVDKWA
jgi:uncharacterized peroxidase-related enzyme